MNRPLDLPKRDQDVVEALRRFGALLPREFLEYFGRKTGLGSQNDINKRLKKLEDQGVVVRGIAPINNGFERPPYYWSLKGHTQSLVTVRHTLLANEVLIKLIRETTSTHFFTERELYASRVRPAFDGWLQIGELGIGIELDTGTQESPTSVREKIARLSQFLSSGYEGHFDTKKRVVWFLTSDSTQRRDLLVRWTEQALSEQQAIPFGFAYADPFTVTGKDLLTSPIWKRPYKEGLVALT